MERLTEKRDGKNVIPLRNAVCGLNLPYWKISGGDIERFLEGDAADRLAAYEDTGLSPEQVKDAIRIAERLATADYPHNFQRERSDIADYMRWITDVMRDAKAWWNGRIKTRAEAEKAMEVSG